jgi:hypothetical protein
MKPAIWSGDSSFCLKFPQETLSELPEILLAIKDYSLTPAELQEFDRLILQNTNTGVCFVNLLAHQGFYDFFSLRG